MTTTHRRIAIMSPHYIHMGETHVIPTLAVELAKLGYQVDLLRAWKEWEPEIQPQGGRNINIVSLGTRKFAPIIPDITRISSWTAYRVWAGTVSIAMLPGLVCYLRRERPDALIARMLTTSAAFGKFVSRTDTKLILSVAGEPSPTRLRNKLWKFF